MAYPAPVPEIPPMTSFQRGELITRCYLVPAAGGTGNPELREPPNNSVLFTRQPPINDCLNRVRDLR